MAGQRSAQILADVVEEAASGSPSLGLPLLLVNACLAALPVTGVSLVWMRESGPGAVLAATDGPASVLEDLQFTLGEGPCMTSSITGRPVLESDIGLTGDARWPAFTAGALNAGVRAVFAFPLQVGGIRLGVLDIYRDSPGDLSNGSVTEALAFGDAATRMLLDMQAEGDTPGGLHPLLVNAVENRAQVHQATGMIMVQSGVSLGEALMLLRARSFASERPIQDVADDVVGRIMRFDGPDRGSS
jgi:hypothetical protein